MTFTIWSNGGKFEWIIYRGDELITRSGLVYSSYASAKRALLMFKQLER